MKILTIGLTSIYSNAIDGLVDNKVFPSRSEAIRIILNSFIKKEKEFLKQLPTQLVTDIKEMQSCALLPPI